MTEQQKRKELHEALDRVLDEAEVVSPWAWDERNDVIYSSAIIEGFDEGFLRGFAKGKAVGSLEMRETLNGSIRGLKEWTAREREAEKLLGEDGDCDL